MKKAVVGIVDTSAQADSIIVELQRLGFGNEQISILYPDKAARGDVVHKKESKAQDPLGWQAEVTRLRTELNRTAKARRSGRRTTKST